MAQNSNTIAILTSAARTATTTSGTFLNKFTKGAQFIIDVTAIAATPTITVDVQAKDGLSAQWYSLEKSQPITGVNTTVLNISPGENGQLPRVFRVVSTHTDADSITYSVAANLTI